MTTDQTETIVDAWQRAGDPDESCNMGDDITFELSVTYLNPAYPNLVIEDTFGVKYSSGEETEHNGDGFPWDVENMTGYHTYGDDYDCDYTDSDYTYDYPGVFAYRTEAEAVDACKRYAATDWGFAMCWTGQPIQH